jgi:hypothetical protein
MRWSRREQCGKGHPYNVFLAARMVEHGEGKRCHQRIGQRSYLGMRVHLGEPYLRASASFTISALFRPARFK